MYSKFPVPDACILHETCSLFHTDYTGSHCHCKSLSLPHHRQRPPKCSQLRPSASSAPCPWQHNPTPQSSQSQPAHPAQPPSPPHPQHTTSPPSAPAEQNPASTATAPPAAAAAAHTATVALDRNTVVADVSQSLEIVMRYQLRRHQPLLRWGCRRTILRRRWLVRRCCCLCRCRCRGRR